LDGLRSVGKIAELRPSERERQLEWQRHSDELTRAYDAAKKESILVQLMPLTAKFSRRSFLTGTAAFVGAAAIGSRGTLARVPAAPTAPLAFTCVKVFDGKSNALREGLTVTVEGNRITSVDAGNKPIGYGVQIIDGGSRTLMPGLIDNHWHAMMAAMGMNDLLTANVGYINLVAADQAEKTLMRGFTTVRDLGGPVFALKRAIDVGIVPGPRIYPSGAMITITGGHGDFRKLSDLPRVIGGPLTRMEQLGGSIIADGPDEVLVRAREQLMQGASQVKLTAGGGVASPFSPLDVLTFTEEELRAAVDAADNWGTYVAVHAYTPAAIQRSITAGAKCIEHGHLMDDVSARLIAENGVWLSTQPFLDDEDTISFPPGSDQQSKLQEVISGTDKVYDLAKKYKIKTAFGTDTLFSEALANRQGAQLAKLVRWYTPAEILAMATSVNGELLRLSGPRNPYPGRLGLVEEGALADLLLVDGNPLDDISLIADPARNFKIIMKDGVIYKNTLTE
jgi:imidazolonepropionase-like amidohydrolase